MAAEDFIAARPSPFVQGFFGATLPFILPCLGVVGVEYDPADLARLKALRHERVLLTPNHPTNTEPALLFHLSCTVGQPFFYLACRETFDLFGGLWGHIIRRVGAYSVIRGTMDRASFRATRELLTQPGAKVVVFPEGEVYSQNDSLLPFHSGVLQIAFWAMEDLRRDAATAQSDLLILPVGIKYRFVNDVSPAIQASLARLEVFTGVKADSTADAYERLRRIGQAMLVSLEHEYRLTPPRDTDPHNLTPRLNAIKEAILLRVASAAGVALPKGDTLPERMRALIHVIETVTNEEHSDSAVTPYDASLRVQQRERARPLLADLRRLANWIAVYDGYVRTDPTPERMVDMLTRLERECFGREKIGGPRICRVRLGEPIRLSEWWDAYEKRKRATVAELTREVEGRVGALLHTVPPPRDLLK